MCTYLANACYVLNYLKCKHIDKEKKALNMKVGWFVEERFQVNKVLKSFSLL